MHYRKIIGRRSSASTDGIVDKDMLSARIFTDGARARGDGRNWLSTEGFDVDKRNIISANAVNFWPKQKAPSA